MNFVRAFDLLHCQFNGALRALIHAILSQMKFPLGYPGASFEGG